MNKRVLTLALLVSMLLLLGGCFYKNNHAVLDQNAAQDLDSAIQDIYDKADYLAHLEVTIKLAENKTWQDVIDEMNGSKSWAYPSWLQDPEQDPQDPSENENGTSTIYLCGSLFKDTDGKYHILTAEHIRGDDYTIEKIAVTFKNGQTSEFVVLGYDSNLDAAILKPKDANFKFNGRLAAFGSSENLKVQQTVVHLGSPMIFPNTCSRGQINNLKIGSDFPGTLNSSFKQKRLIMHDAKIDGGSSGGPLLNLQGELVGINVMVIKRLNAWSLSVPINDIKAVLADLKKGVQR